MPRLGIVVGNKVYVGSLNTDLYCLDANNGKIMWKYKTGGYITSSPAVNDNAVYVTSQEPSSGLLYKLNADNGEIIWTKELPYRSTLGGGIDMHSSPTIAGGMIFTSSNTKIYYGLNETNGETIWTYGDYTAGQFII